MLNPAIHECLIEHLGCHVAEGICRAFGVLEINIPCKRLFQVVALCKVEVGHKLFLYPAIQRLVDRIVGRLSRSGHGSRDDCVLNQFIVCLGCIYGTLVSMQDYRIDAA